MFFSICDVSYKYVNVSFRLTVCTLSVCLKLSSFSLYFCWVYWVQNSKLTCVSQCLIFHHHFSSIISSRRHLNYFPILVNPISLFDFQIFSFLSVLFPLWHELPVLELDYDQLEAFSLALPGTVHSWIRETLPSQSLRNVLLSVLHSHTRVSDTRVSDQLYDCHLILNSYSLKTMFDTATHSTFWAIASSLYSSSQILSLASPNLLFHSIHWGFLKIPIAKITFYSIATFSCCVCVNLHFFILL